MVQIDFQPSSVSNTEEDWLWDRSRQIIEVIWMRIVNIAWDALLISFLTVCTVIDIGINYSAQEIVNDL